MPVIVLYLNAMVLPAVNAILHMNGGETYSTALQNGYLFSYYYIYILLGYFVGKGVISHWKGWLVGLLAVLSFAVCCGVQFYAYSQPDDYLVSYSFPVMPICAGLIFELVRRGAHKLKAVERPVTYLSRIAFAIYFLHIVIMTALCSAEMGKLLGYASWHQAAKTVFLEVVSVAGSVLVIAIFSKIKPLKKYLFLIK